jgi:hypothetical protein
MNLKPFVGRKVIVQFRGAFWMVVDDKGLPSLAFKKSDSNELDADGRPKMEPALMNFHMGTFVDVDGEILFQYVDSQTQRKIQVSFHRDALFSVSTVTEADRIITP